MKQLSRLIPLLALLFFIPACGNTPQKNVYTTLATVGATVDVSMKTAAYAKAHNLITDQQWAQIAAKHSEYMQSYRLACDTAAMDFNQLAPSSLLVLESDLINLINSFLK